MLHWKKVMAGTLALILGATTLAQAQNRPNAGPPGQGNRQGNRQGNGQGNQQGNGQGPAARAEAVLERIHDVLDPLNLTEDQKSKLQRILDDERAKMRELIPTLRDASPEDRREKLRSALDDARTQIKGILTEDQKQQLGDKLDQLGRPGAATQPATRPTTRPTTRPNAGAAGRGGMMIERVRTALKDMGLSDDQKARIDPILEDTAKKFAALREKAQGDAASVRDDMRQLMTDTMTRLGEVLDADQLRTLREKMQQTGPNGPGGGGGGGGRVDAGNEPDQMMDTMSPPSAVATAVTGKTVGGTTQPADRPLLERGLPAPKFSLTRLDGKPANLEAYQGKPLVIVFGSFSCPIFRSKAPSLEQFCQDNKSKANFLAIYTREAHAIGEWEVERNKDENIQVRQATTLQEREKMARSCRDGLKLEKWDWAVDKLDDAVTTSYSGAPNGAVVIDKSGKIVGQLKWAETFALQRLLDQALASK